MTTLNRDIVNSDYFCTLVSPFFYRKEYLTTLALVNRKFTSFIKFSPHQLPHGETIETWVDDYTELSSVQEATYREGLRHGTVIIKTEDIVELFNYVNDKISGTYWGISPSMIVQEEWINNHRHGYRYEWKLRSPHQIISPDYPVPNNQITIDKKYLSPQIIPENYTVTSKEQFHSGYRIGVGHHWYTSGAIMRVINYKLLPPQSEGEITQIQHGLQSNFYRNGLLSSTFNYVDGLTNGVHKKYLDPDSDKGKMMLALPPKFRAEPCLLAIRNFVRGKPDGNYIYSD
jgi:hypothetical protein